MAWLAIEEDGSEYIFSVKPKLYSNGIRYVSSKDSVILLPKGTIAKLLRYDLKWEDEPVEIK